MITTLHSPRRHGDHARRPATIAPAPSPPPRPSTTTAAKALADRDEAAMSKLSAGMLRRSQSGVLDRAADSCRTDESAEVLHRRARTRRAGQDDEPLAQRGNRRSPSAWTRSSRGRCSTCRRPRRSTFRSKCRSRSDDRRIQAWAETRRARRDRPVADRGRDGGLGFWQIAEFMQANGTLRPSAGASSCMRCSRCSASLRSCAACERCCRVADSVLRDARFHVRPRVDAAGDVVDLAETQLAEMLRRLRLRPPWWHRNASGVSLGSASSGARPSSKVSELAVDRSQRAFFRRTHVDHAQRAGARRAHALRPATAAAPAAAHSDCR